MILLAIYHRTISYQASNILKAFIYGKKSHRFVLFAPRDWGEGGYRMYKTNWIWFQIRHRNTSAEVARRFALQNDTSATQSYTKLRIPLGRRKQRHLNRTKENQLCIIGTQWAEVRIGKNNRSLALIDSSHKNLHDFDLHQLHSSLYLQE